GRAPDRTRRGRDGRGIAASRGTEERIDMMQSSPSVALPERGRDGAARAAALAAAAAIEARPTSLVSYRSTGSVIIIGPEAQAAAAARRLHPALRCTVVIQQPEEEGAATGDAKTLPPEVVVLREKVLQVS